MRRCIDECHNSCAQACTNGVEDYCSFKFRKLLNMFENCLYNVHAVHVRASSKFPHNVCILNEIRIVFILRLHIKITRQTLH